jgi:heat shock protein HslJ
MGCSTSQKTADNTSDWRDVMTGTQWKLIVLDGQNITNENTGPKQVHFMLAEKENRFYGSGGCNSVNGTYLHSKPNHIAFSNIATTKMACANMVIEEQFLKMLEEVNNYQLKGDTLVFKVNKNIIAEFIPN